MKKIALMSMMALLGACGSRTVPAEAGSAQPTTQQASAAGTGRQAEAPANPEELTQTGLVERADGTVSTLDRSLSDGQLRAQSVIDKSVPIILVHGALGWGRDELTGLRYWGGFKDTEADLRAQGYQVYTASVGPISSSWDRASELYAQIKGGCVDYGAAHSSHAGHTRSDSAKCYPGFYPQWSAEKPVNIIGHSMGSPTARMLVHLLENGSAADAEGDNLFSGGRAGWVKSVMTLNGGSNGSPVVDNLEDAIPMFKELLLTTGGLSGISPTSPYNLDLGQWGLSRKPGEALLTYVDRAFNPNNAVWKSADNAAYELNVDNSAAQNRWVRLGKHTKYFSWSSSATYKGLITGWHYPLPSMNALFIPLAYPNPLPLPDGLGNLRGTSDNGTFTYGPQWWANDGLVPVLAQHEPFNVSSEAYTGQTTYGGRWYRMGNLKGYDHIDSVGILTLREFEQFYRDQAAFLSSQD